MAENLYNHGDPSISFSGGTVEELIRRGLLVRDGNNTPRSENANFVFSTDNPELDQSEEMIVLWSQPFEYGTNYITLNGLLNKVFDQAHYEKGLEYLKAHGLHGDNIIKGHRAGVNNTNIYTLDRTSSILHARELGVDLETLISEYLALSNLDDQFKDITKVIPLEDTTRFMFQTLTEYEDEVQSNLDMKVFSSDPGNLPDYYIGAKLTDDNIGFYIDLGGRLRASYDSFVLYRASRLILDLLEFANNEDEYVVGRLPSGTVQFVLEKPLVDRLLRKFGSYNVLVLRWNNATATTESLNGIHFERIVDVKTRKLYNAVDVFGYKETREG